MTETAVHVDNLSVYYGSTKAISNVFLDVKKGEYLGIIGPNGGGKSTLLKCILGLIKPDEGTVDVFGQRPGRGNAVIGYVPQFSHLDKLFPISLFDVVLTGRLKTGLQPFYKYTKQDKEAAYNLLKKVGIEKLAKRQISQLSGGEFQKMLIARAMALQPSLLLLDEPTASVDAMSREQIYNLLAELNKDMTIILVTHDLMAISSQVHRLACLNTSLVYHGEPELNEKIMNQLYGCPVDLIAHGVPHRVLKEHNGGNKYDKCNI